MKKTYIIVALLFISGCYHSSEDASLILEKKYLKKVNKL